MRRICLGAVTLALMGSVAALEPAAQPARSEAPGSDGRSAPPVQVQTWTSRTAVWVGDRVTYVIELRRAPNVDVFLDDLASERLRLEGLEILDTATERDTSLADRVVDRVRYTLVTYNAEAAALTVAAIPVRYAIRGAGQTSGDALPAGEITVAPLKLGLRSTIAASGEAVEIRDQRAMRPLPRRLRLATPVGWTLVGLSITPVLLWAGQLVRRARRARKRRPARPPLRQRRAALEEIKEAPVSTPPDRRDAYARLDVWIRDHLQLKGGAPAAALTPAEIAHVLSDAKPAAWVREIEQVLMECELAKYAPDLPPEDRWPAIVDETARLTLARKLS